jgi:hypothetical protein
MIANPTAPNPNKLMAQLRMMPDQQLVQYAQMHKNDPYIFPMAFQESNTRKQMRAAAQNAQAVPAPKVVDQNLQEMAQAMPEEQGIATLPAPNMENMAGGGIVAFDDGGEVPGYAEGVLTGNPLTEYIDKYAQEYKIDPSVLSRIVAAESRGKTTAKNPESTAHGAGQLLDNMWKKMGGGDRRDAETQIRNAAKLLRSNNDNFKNATGRNPSASEAYVTWVLGDSTGRAVLAADPSASVEDVIKKADPKLGDDIIKKNASIFKDKSVADVTQWAASKTKLPSAVPISTAIAAATNPAINQIPGQSVQAPPIRDAGITALTGNNAINQIPGQSVQAPAAKDESTFFGGIADRLGLSPEAQRNISNTLMAPTPLAPVMAIPRAAKSSGLASLGEKLYNKIVPAAGMSEKQIAALRAETEAARVAELAQAGQLPLRVTGPAPAIQQGSQVIPVAQAGEATVESAANLEKARLANQAADQLAASQAAARTAQETAKLPSAAERLQQASLLRESDEAARLTARASNAANAKTAAQVVTGTPSALSAPEGIAALTPNENIGESVFDPTFGGKMPLTAPPKEEVPAGLDVKDLPKDEKTGGTDWNKLMLQMGLQLMAGKSPNAMTNVGEAGLGTLAMQQAEEKAKSERESKMSEADYRKAMGRYYDASTASIERGAKEKNLNLEAEKLIAQKMKELPTLVQAQLAGDPTRLAAVEKNIRQEIYRQLGITPTMAAGAPTGGAKFLGFENPA